MDWETKLAAVAVALTVIGGLFTFYTWQRKEWKEELQNAKSLRKGSDWARVVSDRSWRDQYATLIDKALHGLSRFYGKKLLGWQALVRSFSIALIYPLILFLITWAITGKGMIGGLELLQGGISTLKRLIYLIVALLYLWVIYKLYRHEKRIAVWIDVGITKIADRLPDRIYRKYRKRIVIFLISILYGVLTYFLAGDFALVYSLAGAVVLALVLAFSGAVTLDEFFPLALGFSVGLVFTMAGAMAGAMALAGVFALAGTSAFALVSPLARGATIALFGSLAFALAFPFAGVLLPGFTTLDTLIAVLFLAILPTINSIFDWLSMAASRWLSRQVRNNLGGYKVALTILADLVLAVILLVLLTFSVCFVIAAFDAFAFSRIGSHVIDIADLINRTSTDPLGEGSWIIVMLFSTIIPTALHAALALSSFIVKPHKAKRDKWAKSIKKFVKKGKELSVADMNSLCNYRFFHQLFLPIICFLGLLAISAWIIATNDFGGTLLKVATASQNAVDWFGGVVG